MKNDGQKGKPRGPGFYYGQPVASRLERFSWNRDKRHRQLKYPILIAAEIAERRHKDRHRRFNPPVPRIRNSVSTALRKRERIPLAERYAPTINDLARASIPNRSRSPFVLGRRRVCIQLRAAIICIFIARIEQVPRLGESSDEGNPKFVAPPWHRCDRCSNNALFLIKECFEKLGNVCIYTYMYVRKAIDEEKTDLDRIVTENSRRVCTRNKRA